MCLEFEVVGSAESRVDMMTIGVKLPHDDGTSMGLKPGPSIA